MNKESKCPECGTDLKCNGLALVGGVVMGRYYCPDCTRNVFIERLGVVVYAARAAESDSDSSKMTARIGLDWPTYDGYKGDE